MCGIVLVMDRVTFGKEVSALRKERGMTQADLHRTSGLAPSHISMLERGRRSVTVATMAKLAHGLDVPVARLAELASTR
jgi:transcriptional regulator with XRE-family HTH domain